MDDPDSGVMDDRQASACQGPDCRACQQPATRHPAPRTVLEGYCTSSRNGNRSTFWSALPLKCHSTRGRYSVLNSKDVHDLEPPYGIEP